MKKGLICVMAVIVMFVFSLPAIAGDNDLAGKSQLQLTVDHFFWESDKVSGYGWGTFLLDQNSGWPLIIGEFGPVFHLSSKVNMYLMAATMNDPLGWSFGPALWLEYTGDKNYAFIEYDHYEPFMATTHDDLTPLPEQSYYGYAEYNYSLPDNIKIGVMLETFGYYEEDHAQELMYGPFAQLGRFRVIVAVDETPMLPGDDWLVLRAKISL
ncbi:MAG: hypothetical protein GF365_03815 [Candidatus Buchananbacteria bacterium]|nr:hypothetical protein [Candidatus Buchananbacteria bacterium]